MSGKEIVVTSSNFKETVLSSPIPVLVDFWATWCSPCHMIAPFVSEISSELDGVITVAKVDVDENQDLAMTYGIMSIPTLGIFINGKMVDQIVGAVPKKVILNKINQYITKN